MRKLPILHTIIFILLSFFILFLQFTPAYSVTEDDLEDKIEETQEEIEENESKLESIESRIKEISESNYSVTQKINLLTEEITAVEEEIEEKEKGIQRKLNEIDAKEKILAEKRDMLAAISSDLYRESRIGSIEFFFSKTGIDDLIQTFFVKRSAISFLKDEITQITGEFEDLTVLKQELEDEKKELDEQKKDLDDSYDLLAAERAKLQRELNEKYDSRNLIKRTISGLKTEVTDLQYHLLVVRQGGTNVNVDSVPTSGDYNSTLAGFREKAPSGSFAVFSIGAHTHRNGMSQWGAKARDDAGQTYEQILNAYYPGKSLRTGNVVIDGKAEDIMNNIKIDGYGTKSFEDYYLLGIREINGAWNKTSDMDVLKAQVIAARTYAVRVTNNGDSSICTTQDCQVFSTNMYSGAWAQAVEETEGVILTNSNRTPAFTQYAAVHGGWSNTSGWDTTDGTGNGDWMARAYDSLSGVSWFYKSWYIPLYSSSNCGRYPWMTQTEMSDIVNAYQVWKSTGGDSRITPVFDACHSSGNPYSYTEMRKLAEKPVSSISAVITNNSNGSTQSVTFYTNAGTVTMTGKEFKAIYNMRAPGHLHIPQGDIRYPAYDWVHINIEKK